jgi:hypothetical protein
MELAMPKKVISMFLIGGLIGTAAGSALAADPPTQNPSARVSGGEVIEFGNFHCGAQKSGSDQLAWSCPAQTFASKFKDAPTVLFSIAGFANLTATDGSLSLAVDTKDDVRKDGFQPAVDDSGGKIGGSDKSSISVTWIAIGEGDRGQRPRASSREDRLKLREMRRDEKTKEK